MVWLLKIIFGQMFFSGVAAFVTSCLTCATASELKLSLFSFSFSFD